MFINLLNNLEDGGDQQGGQPKGRFSATVMVGKSCLPSGIWLMPISTIRVVEARMIFSPSNSMVPFRGRRMPETVLRVVDFPAPLGPINPRIRLRENGPFSFPASFFSFHARQIIPDHFRNRGELLYASQMTEPLREPDALLPGLQADTARISNPFSSRLPWMDRTCRHNRSN